MFPKSTVLMIYAIVLLALLEAARSALQCGQFDNVPLEDQPIDDGFDCDANNPPPGDCNVQAQTCQTGFFLPNGTTFPELDFTSVTCDAQGCSVENDCFCADIVVCQRTLLNQEELETFVFACVDDGTPDDDDDDDDDDGAEPSDSTWIFLLSTVGLFVVLFVCCGGFAGYNRRRVNYERI